MEQLLKEVKEILPKLANASEKLPIIGENADNLKQLAEQLKTMEGNFQKLQNDVIQLGKKQIQIKGSGWSLEKKVDFAKWLVASYKKNDSLRNEIFEKYSPSYASSGKVLSTLVDADGGYLVPEDFRPEIWRIAEEASILLSGATVSPITKGNNIPVLSVASGVTVYWITENTQITESNPTFGKDEENAEKLAVRCRLTNELLEDSDPDVGLTDLIITLIGESMAQEIDFQGFAGTGSPFTGILNKAGVNSVVMATGDTSFSDVDFDDLADMPAGLKKSAKINARYWLHRTILNIIRKIKDSQGNYIWSPPANAQPGTIWGWPYVEVEQMPDTGDDGVSTPFIAFGNAKNILVGRKSEMSVLIDSTTEADYDRTRIIVKQRLGIIPALPGAFSVLKTAAV
jgi:HK97 family phage major capsid protein